MKSIKILLIEDDEDDILILREMLDEVNNTRFDLEFTGRLKLGMKYLAEREFDVVLLDLNLPDSSGLDTLRKIQAKFVEAPIIVLTGLDDERLGFNAVQKGAQDYLVKGQVNSILLIRAINYAIARQRMLVELNQRTLELQASELRFRNIIENNSDGILIIDQNRIIHFVNPAAESILDRKSNELIGETFEFPVSEDESVELNIVRQDEEKITVEMRIVEIEWEGKDVFLASLRNITRRKQAEEQIRRSENWLSTIINSIGDAVIATDQNGYVKLMNPVAEYLTGWKQKEAKDNHLKECFSIANEETDEYLEVPATEVMNEADVIEVIDNTILVSKDGTKRPIAYSAFPIIDGEYGTIGLVLVFRDITEKRKTEQELQKVQRLESLAVLAKGIAHDFNNLLTAILGNIHIAQMYANEEKVVEKMKEVKQVSIRAKDLVKQLLTFSRSEKSIKQKTYISELFENKDEFASTNTDIQYQFYISENLSPVKVNRIQIRQVIKSLVNNANQAMSQGGTIKIKVQNINLTAEYSLPLQAGKYVQISIEDEGIGITKENLAKIFDPYFSTQKMGTQKGMGLGLTICHSIIKEHEGYINIESELGVGTIVYIYLPVYQD